MNIIKFEHAIFSLLLKSILVCLTLVSFFGCSNTPDWKGLPVNDFDQLSSLPTQGKNSSRPLSSLQNDNDNSNAEYRIGPYDELVVSVWGRPDLGSQILEGRNSQRKITIVDSDGNISLPFIGTLQIADLSVREIRNTTRKAYAGLIDTPEIEVQISNFRAKAVYVEGAVRKPGKIYLSNNMRTLSDVINAANGFSQNADITHAELSRDNEKYYFNYQDVLSGDGTIHQLNMKNGDRIYVPFSYDRNIYVFGEVNRQKKITIPPSGMTLANAIASVYGPNVISADMDEIYFIRPKNPEESRLFRIRLEEILKGPDVFVQPKDRIYVTPTALAIWDRTWRQLLPFFSAGSSTFTVYSATTP